MLAGGVALAVCGVLLLGRSDPAPSDGAAPMPAPEFTGYPVLEPWTEAMRGSDDEAANLVVLGDSVSEGYGFRTHLERRWVDRLQRALRARAGVDDCTTEPGGYHGTRSIVPARYHAPSMPDPHTAGRTAPQPAAGPGGRARDLKPGGSVTWQVEAESVDIGYRTRPNGGSLQVSIDGRVPFEGVAIPTEAESEEGRRRVWSSQDLEPGTHTVTVRNNSNVLTGALTTVTDITPFAGDRDRCVHVLDASRSGATAERVVRTPSYLADALSLDPDLLMIPLGFNDARSGTSPAAFGRILDELIEQTRDRGYDGPILLVGWFTPRWGPSIPPWSHYRHEMSQRTEHDDVSYLDLSAVLPPVRGAPQGIYMDSLHPSAAAQPGIARSFLEVLAPREEIEETSVPE